MKSVCYIILCTLVHNYKRKFDLQNKILYTRRIEPYNEYFDVD